MAASPPPPNGRPGFSPLAPLEASADSSDEDSRGLVALWVAAGAAIVLLGSIGLLAAVSLPVGIAGAVMGRRALRAATSEQQARYARAALWVGAIAALASFAAGIAWIAALASGSRTAPSADDTSWRPPAAHVAASAGRPARLARD
jgi:hypothetical protein